MNGDGYADVIVGAPRLRQRPDRRGRGLRLPGHGGRAGRGARPGRPRATRTAPSSAASVGTAGDVNGDGYADVIVGARTYDNGQTDEGAALVYLGRPAGLGATAAWTAESDQANAQFGYSVATAGDVNGDGYADVIVGGASLRQRPDRRGPRLRLLRQRRRRAGRAGRSSGAPTTPRRSRRAAR